VAVKVVVQRRWPWQREEFSSEGVVGVSVNAGVLMITTDDKIRSYNPREWRTVTSTFPAHKH
jgi:hypothetical protein